MATLYLSRTQIGVLTARMDADVVVTAAIDLGPVALSGGIGISASTGAETPIMVDLSLGMSLHSNIPMPLVVAPGTGREKYKVVVTDLHGTPFGELENATVGSPSWELSALGGFDFTLPSRDPKAALCVAAIREVQVWKGLKLIWWGPIVRTRDTGGGTVQYQCQDLKWYFTRRYVGRVPVKNLLKNPSWEAGLKDWRYTFKPGSIPAAPPKHSLSKDTINGKYSLEIAGSDAVVTQTTTLSGSVTFSPDSATLTSAGVSAITKLANSFSETPTVTVGGHADSLPSSYPGGNGPLSQARANAVRSKILDIRPGASVTATGYGTSQPVASNATSAGRLANRRVEVAYTDIQTAKGHRQFAGQIVKYSVPAAAKRPILLTFVGWCKITEFLDASKDGWGVYIQRTLPGSSKVLGTASVSINAETPRNVWNRMECAIEVPADGKTYDIDVRFYPPSGTCIWDEASLTAGERLGFYNVDQALIVRDLARHAQDPDMGKTSLNIGTHTSLTGVKRDREYLHSERMEMFEAIMEFPTLADGVEVEVEFTETGRRTLRTYFPRKEERKLDPTDRYVLALGSNLMNYSLDTNGEMVSSQIIVRAEGEGSDREEGIATDTRHTEGVVLETVYDATPFSAISSLQAQANRGLKRYRRPIALPSVTTSPRFVDELWERVRTGTVVRVVVRDGATDIDALYRVVGMSLDPSTDQFTYTLTPED